MWPIVVRELKDRKWSLLAYVLMSVLILWLYVATFRSSQNSVQQLQQLVKTYPKGLLEALGLGNLNLDTLEKYLNAKHFSLLWPILAIVLALSRAGKQIAGEIQSGTVGLLLSLPITRGRIFFAKYIAGLITILAFTFASVFGVIPLAAAYNIPSHFHILLAAWILTSLFMGAVYCVALAVSACVSESSRMYAILGPFLLFSYLANIFSLVAPKYAWVKHFSLFHYFNTQEVLATGHIGLQSFIVFCTVIIVFTVFGMTQFVKRDISV